MSQTYDHDIVLSWRTRLSEIEQNTLIPEYENRLDGMKEILVKMLAMLDQVRNDKVFIASVDSILNPQGVQPMQPMMPAAVLYCDEVSKQIRTKFIPKIDLLLSELKEVNDYKAFARFTNKFANLCQDYIQNKTTLFWYSVRPYIHAINKTTNSVATTPPVEYAFIMRPFDTFIENLNVIASGTFGTIDAWFKSQGEWKREYLAFRSNESMMKNSSLILKANLATVLVAISLSCLFLFMPDLLGQRSKNEELSREIVQLKSELQESQKHVVSPGSLKAKSPKASRPSGI